jgi:predicted GNAT family N-acyltransferase
MKSATDSDNSTKIFVWNSKGELQGATSYRIGGNRLYVGLLGSRGKGAGSEIMRELFQKVVDNNLEGLGLSALEMARPFYYKMGLTTNWNFGGNMGITRDEIVQQLRRMK